MVEGNAILYIVIVIKLTEASVKDLAADIKGRFSYWVNGVAVWRYQ